MLDIGIIYAGSQPPEAKGKVEKAFDYFKSRVTYLCERNQVKSLQEAQKIVDEVCQYYNEERVHFEKGEIPLRRWEERIRAGKSRLRPLLKIDLDVVFPLHYPRKVKKDGPFSFQGRQYRLKQLAGDSITIAFMPGQKIMVLENDQKVAEFLV